MARITEQKTRKLTIELSSQAEVEMLHYMTTLTQKELRKHTSLDPNVRFRPGSPIVYLPDFYQLLEALEFKTR